MTANSNPELFNKSDGRTSFKYSVYTPVQVYGLQTTLA